MAAEAAQEAVLEASKAEGQEETFPHSNRAPCCRKQRLAPLAGALCQCRCYRPAAAAAAAAAAAVLANSRRPS